MSVLLIKASKTESFTNMQPDNQNDVRCTIENAVQSKSSSMRKAYKSIIFAVLTFYCSIVVGQVTVDQTLTPEELVQQVLLGDGIVVSNVTFNGLAGDILNNQIGLYNGPSAFVDFDEGIIMASGDVIQTEGGFGGVVDPNITGDPDLYAIANAGGTSFSVNNCAILEFDFIPTGDTLSIRYVFTSNEYPSFTCSSFNDPFGFFLSGPGIVGDGTFTNNAINIATIPGSDTPIGVNTINSGVPSGFNSPQNCLDANPNFVEDSQYFVDNNPPVPGDIQFPGMTVTLTASALVTCGETYHIKLAIADASDGALDAGVFLEAGSFTSSAPIEIDMDVISGVNDSTLVEGCGNATFTFSRELDLTEQTVYLDIGGDSENGIDFTEIPDSIIFPIGETEISFTIEAFHDGIIEGIEEVNLIIENENVCGGDNPISSFTFYIDEYAPLELNGHDGLIDCGEPIELEPEVSGGSLPHNFLWSTGETTPTITVAPIETTTYTLTVTDSCGIFEETTEFFVEVPVYDSLTVDIGEDWTLTCITPVLIEPEINGGSGDFVFEWFNNGVPESDELIWDQLPEGEGVLTFTVTDHCGNTANDQLNYETPPVDVNVNLGADYFVSCIDETPITSNFSGGVGELSFEWLEDGELLSNLPAIQYQSNVTSELILIVTDECGNFNSDTVIVNVPDIPLELVISQDTTICLGDNAFIEAEASGGEGGFSYHWTPNERTTSEIIVSPADTTTYTVVATDICGESISGEVTVNVTWVNALFDLTYIGTNGVELTNLSTPDMEYLWHFGDGLKSRLFEPVHEYYSAGNYLISLYVTDSLGCSDLFSMEYNPPMFLYIPNAFSPNGDGNNEIFKAEGVSIKSFEMRIFNRQGELLFETFDIEEGWDGSAMGAGYYVPDGVYVYEYKAESFEGGKVEDKGQVTIIR